MGSEPPEVIIEQLDPAVINALADRDVDAARQLSGLAMSDHFVDDDNVGTWRIRRAQLIDHPGHAAWITGAVIDSATGAVVGRAGFHGPPDDRGMVEVGYAIDPPLRRRGYARATLEFLINRAGREPGVRVVRATISPGNAASINLVRSRAFVEVGEQWDEEDGLEIIYELPLEAADQPTSNA